MAFVPDAPSSSPRFVPDVGVGEDLYNSIPRYAETAVSSALGLPGDILKGFQSLDKAVLNHPNFDSPALNNAKFTGSDEVRQGLQQSLGYDAPSQPNTSVGKAVDLGASLLPTMVGGPESMLAKLGTRVAVPAAAATTAGELGAQVGGEKGRAAGETLGLLLSPFASHSVIGNVQSKLSKGVQLTSAEMKTAENELYDVARKTGTSVDPQAFKTFALSVANDFSKKYVGDVALFRQTDPSAYLRLKSMDQYIAKGIGPDLDVMHKWRKQAAKDAFKTNNPSEGSALVYKRFQQFFGDMERQPQYLVGPKRDEAISAWRAADEMHMRSKNSAQLDYYSAAAKARSGKNYTQAGDATALRRDFGRLHEDVIKQPIGKSKFGRFLTQEQKDQLARGIEGTPYMNTLKKMSSVGTVVKGGVGALVVGKALAAIGLGGPVGAAIAATPAVVGIASKILYNRATKAEIAKFVDMVKQGKKTPQAPTHTKLPPSSLNYQPLLPFIAGQHLREDQ